MGTNPNLSTSAVPASSSQAFSGAAFPTVQPPGHQPATNPAASNPQTVNQAFAPNPNQAFASPSRQSSQNPNYVQKQRSPEKTRRQRSPPTQQQSSAAPVPQQQQAPQQAKPKLEHVVCGQPSCKALNGVPPGAPSFNCWKCGRTSTKPGLQKQPVQYEAKQTRAPPQKAVQNAKPVQVVSGGTSGTTQVVVVQQPQTQVVTAPVVGNQIAYSAYGGSSSAAFATGVMAGALLDPYPYYGFGYGYGYGYGCGPYW